MTDDAFHDYLRALRDLPTLDRDEVRRLCAAIEVGVLASDRIAQGRDVAAVKRELRHLEREGAFAFNLMVSHNLRLVVSVAKRMCIPSSSMIDLVQAGNTGLIAAVQRFDYQLGFTFSTYAIWWIRKAIGQEIAHDRMIRLPRAPLERVRRVAAIERELVGALARTPTVAEIADAAEMSIADVKAIHTLEHRTVSLDDTPGHAGRETLGETLPSDEADIADVVSDHQTLTAALRAVDQIDPRYRDVITLRFGLGGHPPLLPRHVANVLDIKEGEVRALEQEAIRALRERLTWLT